MPWSATWSPTSRPRTSRSTNEPAPGTASSAGPSSRISPGDVGWWRYRIPGRGQLDWNRIVDRLYSAGYNGAIAVEHEDPVWGGTLDKTKQGLQIAAQTLRPFIVPE